MRTPREHWEAIYESKPPSEVSWFQSEPTVSLQLIMKVAPERTASILDAGGGASTLVDALLKHGYVRPAVLDIAPAALHHAQLRLGAAAELVEWRCCDLLEEDLPSGGFDVWHDRAVFHFLTEKDDRERYVRQVTRAVKANSFVIIATFADDGPERCSGLNVLRYTPSAIQDEFGKSFELVESVREQHLTPSGSGQSFQYCVLVNRGDY